jgi:hypothetical protein
MKIYSKNIKEVQYDKNAKSTVMDLKKNIYDDSNEIDPQFIGSMMYLVNTRIDSCHVVSVLSHFMCQPRQTH